ncbi:MAG: sigma-54-dependent transcriptional regulator, partial [Blastocatellia bacterium]
SGPRSEIVPVELDARPFRLRVFGSKRSDEVVQALQMVAASRFLSLPHRSSDLIEPEADHLVTASDEMRQVVWRAKRLAQPSRVEPGLPKPILLLGEPGVGKEVIARLIHVSSPRKHRNFNSANMAFVERDLCATHLFGSVKGAFTGATHDRPGLISAAEGGTLLLDEIGEMDERDQAKLLRVLQTGRYNKVGSDHEFIADVQFILATNRNAKTDLRQDILGRCNVLTIPPLRARKADIKPLALRFALQGGIRLTDGALLYLEQQQWPGNVRQLEKLISECRVFHEDLPDVPVTAEAVAGLYAPPDYEPLGQQDVTGPVIPVLIPGETLQQAERRFSRAVLGESLTATDQIVAKAARLLGITPQGFRKRAIACGYQIRGGSDEVDEDHPYSA